MARKKSDIHYIYKTTCLVTGRYYIGMHSTTKLGDGYMGSGRRLRCSIRKYGVENHIKEILEFLPNREALIERENEIVTNELIQDKNCMNLRAGGTGGFSIEQQRLNQKKSNAKQKILRETNPEWVKKRSDKLSKSLIKAYNEERKKVTRPDWTGKKHSEETKLKMKERKINHGIGGKNSQYGTYWITKDGTNKKIKKEKLETFLLEGWEKGRKIKRNESN